MKNIYIILVLLSNIAIAQSPVIDIEDYGKEESIAGAYYKDINNYFNAFTGTWIYTNENTSLKIVLNKKTVRYTGKFYTDYVVGEYQYIENGVEKINTLHNLGQRYNKGLAGEGLLGVEDKPYCDECDGIDEEDEKRLLLSFSDHERNITGSIIFRKTVVNGQPALEAYLFDNGIGYYNEANPPQYLVTTVPSGKYILIKQNDTTTQNPHEPPEDQY